MELRLVGSLTFFAPLLVSAFTGVANDKGSSTAANFTGTSWRLVKFQSPPDPFNGRIPKDSSYVRSYTIKDGHLFLSLKADGGTYESEPMVVLENTYWKLTRLGDVAVTAPHSKREPHIVLQPDTRRVTGSGGCNSLNGSYELDGNHLTFSKVVTTMMMCMDGMDTEQNFLAALSKTKNWSITGQELKLSDGDGNVVATLEVSSQ
jgi:heat shock protein HslJ